MRSLFRYVCDINKVYLLEVCDSEPSTCRLACCSTEQTYPQRLSFNLSQTQRCRLRFGARLWRKPIRFACNVATVNDISRFASRRSQYRSSARMPVVTANILWLCSVPPDIYRDSIYRTRGNSPFLLHRFCFIIYIILHSHLRLCLISRLFLSAFLNNIFIYHYSSPLQKYCIFLKIPAQKVLKTKKIFTRLWLISLRSICCLTVSPPSSKKCTVRPWYAENAPGKRNFSSVPFICFCRYTQVPATIFSRLQVVSCYESLENWARFVRPKDCRCNQFQKPQTREHKTTSLICIVQEIKRLTDQLKEH